MQIKIFTIPIAGDDAILEEMNLFLRAHKIVDVRKEMANGDGCASWTFCITYMMDNITVNGNGVS